METIAYQPEFGLEVVKLWRQSFQRAMGLEEHNRINELRDHLDYFTTIPPEHIRITMDDDSGTITGFMVLTPGELQQLYIQVDFQGRGLGRFLLEQAKATSPEGLSLYTFQKNKRAQTFYESNGFVEIGRGFADFDNNPWASSRDQLADIRYRWQP